MKAIMPILFLSVVTAPVTVAQEPTQPSESAKIVTAAQINGTWRYRHNEFRIWALGHQKLKVEFSGVYEYMSPQGPSANTGEGSGIAVIEGDTVTFKPDDSEDECSITMKYLAGKLRVSQVGICGFGHNVTAEGDYRRVSRAKPKFGEP
jgi:hypothetical protein